MNRLFNLKNVGILALTSVASCVYLKPVSALDYDFSFSTATGNTVGEVLNLADNTFNQTGAPVIVSITTTTQPGADTGTYSFASGSGFTVIGSVIQPGSVWQGSNGGSILLFTFGAPNAAGVQLNGQFGTAPATFSLQSSTGGGGGTASAIPLEFSTIPGLIAVGGVLGVSHLARKRKQKIT